MFNNPDRVVYRTYLVFEKKNCTAFFIDSLDYNISIGSGIFEYRRIVWKPRARVYSTF